MPASDAKIDHFDQRALVGAVGENAERAARDRAVMGGTLHRVAEGVVLGDQALRLGEIACRLLLALQRAAPEIALAFIAPQEGKNDGQGYLALAEIVADRLAQRFLLGGIVERVVDQLERDAEVEP